MAMNTKNLIELAESFRSVMNPDVYPRSVDNFIELIESGEPEIAIENLITELYDFDLSVTKEQVKRLHEANKYVHEGGINAPEDYAEIINKIKLK